MRLRTHLAAAFVWLVMLTSWALPVRADMVQGDYGLTETAVQTGLPQGASPIGLAARIVNVALGFTGVLLVVLFLYAGFLWMTAAGSEEKITKAKRLMGNAVVGLALVLVSYAIASFVLKNIVQSTGGGGRGNTATSTCARPNRCEPAITCAAPRYIVGDCSGGQVCCTP